MSLNWPKLAIRSRKLGSSAVFSFYECVHCFQGTFLLESINPFMPGGLSHHNYLDRSISNNRVSG